MSDTIDLPRVRLRTPAFRIDSPSGLPANLVTRIGRLPGVAQTVDVAVEARNVRGPRRNEKLSVGAVRPLAFRRVAPPSTASYDFVWTSLLAGRAVVTFASSKRLGVGDDVGVSVGGLDLDVGAYAENGQPNVADVLVSDDVGRRLGIDQTSVLLVVAEMGTDVDRLGRVLRHRVDARVRRLVAPTPETPSPEQVGTAQGDLIGTMRFRVLEDGFIDPDPAWVSANIARGTVPILGTVVCHRLVFPQLVAALSEIDERDLEHLIHPRDYGGCYVPRFIGRDVRRSLSMHAFGLAIDLNVAQNYMGTKGNMDPRIVAIFERWGFEWGGHWSVPDPMHFELDRLIDV